MRSAPFFSSLLCAILHCTALHCSSLLSSHLHLSTFSFSLLSLSLPASLSHYTLLSLLCIALCSIVWENTVHTGFFRARAEYTPATGGRGFRCSCCSRFGLPRTLWISVGWTGGEGREEGESGQRAAQVSASFRLGK